MAQRRPTSTSDAGDAVDDRSDPRPGKTSAQGSLSDNLVFAAVDNPRRRFILKALKEEHGEAGFDELVDDVARIENHADGFDPDGDHREMLEDIYDVDLPELSDIGVVNVDETEGTVELGPYADELDLESLTPDTE